MVSNDGKFGLRAERTDSHTESWHSWAGQADKPC